MKEVLISSRHWKYITKNFSLQTDFEVTSGGWHMKGMLATAVDNVCSLDTLSFFSPQNLSWFLASLAIHTLAITPLAIPRLPSLLQF